MLTVLAVADQVSELLYDHFQPERWRHIDLVLSCGDLPPEYLGFLCSSLNVPVLYVRGNHDGSYETDRYDGCENVHGRIVNVRGVRVAGFEGCRRYNRGPYQRSEGEMRRAVWRTRLRAQWQGKPQIVLAHAPPAGCHDGPDPCHRGFECFHHAIAAWQPSYFIHGHVHAYRPGEKETMLGSTKVVNAFPYHVFQMEEGAAPLIPPDLRGAAGRQTTSAGPSGRTGR